MKSSITPLMMAIAATGLNVPVRDDWTRDSSPRRSTKLKAIKRKAKQARQARRKNRNG